MRMNKNKRKVLRPWVKQFIKIGKICSAIFMMTMICTTPINSKSYSDGMKFPMNVNSSSNDSGVDFSMFLDSDDDVSQPLWGEGDNIIEFDDEEEIEVVQEPTIEYDLDKVGYVNTSGLRIRENPDTVSNVIEYLSYGEKIEYSEYDEEWLVISINDNYGFINKKYIVDEIKGYRAKEVHGDKRKSYMDYTKITSKSSPQYKLQHSVAYTGDTGIRMVDDRYCVALGSFYTHTIGQYVDLVLENGTIIPCIIGDQKDDRDTNSSNTIAHDGSATEFIVETRALPRMVRRMGDIGYTFDNWLPNVVEIRIYDTILEF